MFQRALLCFVILLMITGCSAQTGKKDLTNIIQNMEQGLKASDITSLQIQVDELRKLYDKHEWKIHLLGDEGEYERLNETINRLKAAIEAEELSDAKLELGTLKTIVKDIYSL